MPQLQFKFDPNQDYQLQAIQSVVDLFQGLPRHDTAFTLGEDIVPNLPPYQDLLDNWLFNNVRAVQEQNDPDRRLLDRDMLLHVDEGLEVDRVSNDSWRYPNFTVEMETGTGKTYVYLRTALDLRQRYGFRKFIVVVPSVAIYEGVVKHFDQVRSHFAALYGNETVNLIRYDGSRLSALRAFATSSFVEILIITIQSFNRHSNRIYRPSEQLPGERLPYQYIQETRPILILDEPQNMESDKARAALRTLHPLFALRYSATHRSSPNHLYSLPPFEAFQRGLVKRIQVDAVTARDDFNRPFLALTAINYARSGERSRRITATVRTYVTDASRTREADVTLHQGDDLHAKTGRDDHQNYIVQEIHAGQNWVEFTNGIKLHLAETIGPSRPEIFRVQIERTVLRHMERQQELYDQGIKVLSLFFIDRVANYVEHDGLIRRLFQAAFDKHKVNFPFFRDLDVADVHRGYFAVYRRRNQTEFVDTSGRNQRERKMEKEAFQLIMRHKERLLSFDEKVSFIFAHSALKEGWDNPNVFQICTLNQTVSTMKKRQEIGRGMRIPVNQSGERVFDDDVNILTVVANESYQTYAETLQNEYIEDGHAIAPPKPTPVGKATACRNDDIFTDDRFRDFWTKLLRRTDYRIHVDTPALIQECVDYLNNVAQFPKPVIVIETGEYIVTTFTIAFEAIRSNEVKIRVRAVDTRDNEWHGQAPYYRKGADLSKALNDARLRGFKIKTIVSAGDDSRVTFTNGQTLSLEQSIEFQTQAGQAPRRQQVTPEAHTYPVFNLIDRAARETNLTRPTLNAIFKGLRDDKQRMLLRNPEGFAAAFIAAVKETLANHVVEHIQFILTDAPAVGDLEHYFPSQKEFVQRELVPAGPNGLYDQVQTDSDVERHFVTGRLVPDDKIISYFKFPTNFKIPFPKLIGNYNPDWGILRYDDEGNIILELVRETKGTEELDQLQFPHEKRKVRAAQKHFYAINLDYRVITDATPQWWLSSDDIPTQDALDTS